MNRRSTFLLVVVMAGMASGDAVVAQEMPWENLPKRVLNESGNERQQRKKLIAEQQRLEALELAAWRDEMQSVLNVEVDGDKAVLRAPWRVQISGRIDQLDVEKEHQGSYVYRFVFKKAKRTVEVSIVGGARFVLRLGKEDRGTFLVGLRRVAGDLHAFLRRDNQEAP